MTTATATSSSPTTETSSATRLRTALVALALACAAFVSSPLHLPLNNPNEGVRVFATRALVEHHTTAIDDVVRDWGYIDDKSKRDGHLFSSKAPLVTLLAAGAYAVVHPVTGDLPRATLTRFCRVTGVVLPTALCLGFTWWLLRRRLRDAFVVDVAMVGLVTSTGLLASLHVFSGHALVAAIAAALTALALHDRPSSAATLALTGVLVASAACAEYPAALLAPLAVPVVLRAPARPRAFFVVIAAALVASIPTLMVHTASFGAPWRTGYSFLENASYRPLVQGTLFGIGVPDGGVLATVLFSPAVGLFFYAPLCLLALPAGLRLPRRQRVVVVVVVVLFLLFIAGFRGWRGGWSVGPRYLSELWGVLVVVAAAGLHDVRAAWVRPAFVVAALVGVVHSGVAGATFPHLPDLLANPVGELALPLVARGVAPDSVPLALGLSPATSVVVVVIVVAAPLLLSSLLHAPRTLVAWCALPLVVMLDLACPGTDPAARGREVRRALDNWRPERGVPYLNDGIDDPRVLFAIDRGRAAHVTTCRFDAPRVARGDVGPGAHVLARASLPDEGLVVVDDALADAIAPLGARALVVAFVDVERLFAAGVPCDGDGDGDVVVVTRDRARLPTTLRAWPVRERTSLGDGWVRLVLARDGGGR